MATRIGAMNLLLELDFFVDNKKPKILCLGAHPDDIEIGCGGTIIRLSEKVPDAQFYWVVFSGNEQRRKEAILSANSFVPNCNLTIKNFQESYFPFIGADIKDYFEQLKDISPDLIFTHFREDLHQDHKVLSNLTWNTFRNNLILEYEIPKYDGDLITPNLYVPLPNRIVNKKISIIIDTFKTQKTKNWFTKATFRSILRVRGIECNSHGYAEGFHVRKIVCK
jgi:LmbE family N-acetylglucosaminyl deacetylase